MKVALTGASGHLGSAIIRELIHRDKVVKSLIRDDMRSIKNLNTEIINGSIFSNEALIKLMTGCSSVIHCAAEISINGDQSGKVYKTNVEGVYSVIKAAMECGIKRIIHISSIHVYQQQPKSEKLDESRAFIEESAFHYDRSKRTGQQIALSANGNGMEVIAINPTALIGPPDYKPSLLGKAIIDLYKGRIPAMFEGGFDFCDTRDVANAVANALNQGKPGENYLVGGKWYSMKHFAQTLYRISGKKRVLITLPTTVAKAGLPFVKLLARWMHSDPIYTNESIEALANGNRNICYEKATNDLNYRARPFETTMQDTFYWFRDNGYLE